MTAVTIGAFPRKHIRVIRSVVIYFVYETTGSCKIACKRKTFEIFNYLSTYELSMPIIPPSGLNFSAISKSNPSILLKYSVVARK